jgi:uncharacterized membrane protein
MRKLFFSVLIFCTACTLPEEKEQNPVSKKSDTTIIETHDTNTASIDTSDVVPLNIIKKVKSPNGIYRTILPFNGKMEQTIAFNKDYTYQLQEKYTNNKSDSIVITEGTWAPSDGVIWLYKDQVIRGRYKWEDETLQYYSPLLKKTFPMKSLQDAMQNATWKNKAKQGASFIGIGTEPFWNIELDNQDSLSFQVSEWKQPLRVKIDSSFNNIDSAGYIAQADSVQIRVTIFPHFCSDGMSDFVYRNKIKVQYNQQTYSGCGVLYRQQP